MENINTRFGGSDDSATNENRQNEELWKRSNTVDDRLNVSGAVNGDITDGLYENDRDRETMRNDEDLSDADLAPDTTDDDDTEVRDWGTVDPQNTRTGTSMNDPSGPGSAV